MIIRKLVAITILAGLLTADVALAAENEVSSDKQSADRERDSLPRAEHIRQYTRTGGVLSREKFVDPPIEARGNPFWAIPNGYFDLGRITRELEEMKDKGFGGAAYWDTGPQRNRGGVPAGPAWMGPESTRAIAHATREAGRLGLEMCVEPASSWMAGGHWVKPEDRAKQLFVSETTVEGPKRLSGQLPFPQYRKRKPRGGDGLPEYYEDVAVLALPVVKGKTVDPDAILDLSSHMDKTGLLTWDAPKGTWCILRFVCTNTGKGFACPSPNSRGYIVDYLRPAAMRGHLQHIFDTILKELGLENFADTGMIMSELGSPEIDVDRAWTQDMRERFQKYRGYDVIRFLPAVFGWTLRDKEYNERFMHDWKKTISDLMCDTYREATQVSHENGLLIRAESGGPGGAAEALKALGSVDIPQGEFWLPGWRMYFIKVIACASHTYGRKIVDAEAFTGPQHWMFGPFDYKFYADRAFYEGLNRFCYHNMTHTHPDGGLPGWMFGWGEHFSITDTWWAKSKPFHHDYIARSCYMLQQGLFVGDVCYYYGDHGGAMVGSKKSGDPSNVPKLPSNHMAAHRTLPRLPKTPDPALGFGYDYDVCNQEVIETRMSVKNGRIVLPDGMSYELLSLRPDRGIDYDVLLKLEELVKAGATIVGPKPLKTNTLTDYPNRDRNVEVLASKMWGACDGKTVTENRYGKGRVVWGKTLRELLMGKGIGPDFSFVGADSETDIEFIHRRTANEDIYYVVNTRNRAEDVECTFRVKGRQPELWITDNASVRKIAVYDEVEGGTRIPMHLPPWGSAFVVFRGRASADHVAVIKKDGVNIFPGLLRHSRDLPVVEMLDSAMLAWEEGKYELKTAGGEDRTVHVKGIAESLAISGPWEVRFPEGWGAAASKSFDQLISWTEDVHMDIKHFSGTATYHRTFEVPEELIGRDKHVEIDLGEVKEIADVWLNGEHLGILWKKPFRVDVSRVLKPGRNTLRIEITNLWANRLIGDAGLPEEQRRTNTNIVIKKDRPLRKSGLLGPVRLISARKVML